MDFKSVTARRMSRSIVARVALKYRCRISSSAFTVRPVHVKAAKIGAL
jgi:hypothetical protein